MKTELKTEDLLGVEILAPGTWEGNKTVTIPSNALEDFVTSFDELTANKDVNYEPPAKLGHSNKQALLQSDGYPSAGWVKSLKVRAGKLVDDIRDVPKALAEIIKAGGYKKVSAEFYTDYDIGGKKYPWVLKAISFLGADIPAVKSIRDIATLYAELTDEKGVPYDVVIFEESLDQHTQKIRDAFRSQRGTVSPFINDCWVIDVYPSYVIVEMSGKLYQVGYSENEEVVVFDMQGAAEVKKVVSYQPVVAEVIDTEVLMESELRKLLGLDEKANVLEAVNAIKTRAESVNLAETQRLTDEVTALKSQISARDKADALKARDARVSAAIAAGKILPAQKAQAEVFALSSPEGFDAFIAAAALAVELGERGTSQNKKVDFTEAERQIAGMFGVSDESLAKSKEVE